MVGEGKYTMKTAYKQADGQKIEDRRIVVDVERGRTVKGWAPRRLGGWLGGAIFDATNGYNVAFLTGVGFNLVNFGLIAFFYVKQLKLSGEQPMA